MALIVIAKARAGVEARLNPHDPRVQRVVAAFVDAMRECARETLGPEQAARFLSRFEEMATNWESKVD
jgi:hypothetical protein